ncbi:MAG: ABC transporter permease [Chloroflexi bacterium]|nr:ABC transporter permease [Chloroflexota bacterium]
MTIIETIRTAFESLAENKLRTMLTMLGVIIGVMSVVTLLAVGSGVSNYISGQFSTLGAKQITISSENRVANAKLTVADLNALSDRMQAPDLLRVVPVVNGNLRVSAGLNNRSTSIVGTNNDYFRLRNTTLKDGAYFGANDLTSRARVAVLGGAIAETLFPNGSAVGSMILVDAVPFKVIGVLVAQGGFGPQTGDDNVHVPLTVAQEKLFVKRTGGSKGLSQIYAELVSADKSTAAATEITAILRKEHKLLAGQVDDFRIFNQSQVAESLNSVVTALTAFLAAIAAISLLVGGIGIMNIMLVSVTERTREIGVRKAVGARDGNIRFQFLIEALVVTSLAGVIGILVGAGLAALIGVFQTQFKPVVQASSVGISLSVSVAVGVVFGLYPAWRASRLQPVEALRYE